VIEDARASERNFSFVSKKMEAVLSSEAVNTDVLPNNLQFSLDPTGSFVTGKRDATVYALGNSYAPNGVKIMSDFTPLTIP
jgi:hypothetical protein